MLSELFLSNEKEMETANINCQGGQAIDKETKQMLVDIETAPPPPLSGGQVLGIGGVAEGGRVEIYDDSRGNITGYITLPTACHVSLGVYHTAEVYLLLPCWHISTRASLQNTKKKIDLVFNTK